MRVDQQSEPKRIFPHQISNFFEKTTMNTMQDTTSQRKLSIEKDPTIVKDGNGVPSGFVLKLYQMVNGAPDEIISVRFALLVVFVILLCASRVNSL